MQYLHTNNASSNLRFDITAVAVSLSVTSGHGSLFPNPGLDQGFFVTVEDRRSGRIEIMFCTTRVGDTLTVTRGQQGTVPQSFTAGVNVSNRVTAQILNEFSLAMVSVVDPLRIPPITSSMIVSLDAAKLIGPGVANLAVLPAIPSSQITSLDAAKLTGTIASAQVGPSTIPAANLPTIPSNKITAVAGEAITTGTIAVARIPVLASAKISDLDAAKLTGTINEARFPTAFSITGAATVGSLNVTNNVSIGGAITAVDSIVSVGDIQGALLHKNNGGYFYVGTFSSTYGSGYARIWFNENANIVTVLGTTATGGTTLAAGTFEGSGAGLTGIPFSAIVGDHNDVGSFAMLRYNGSSVITPGVTTAGTNLDYSNANGSSTGSSPPGTWMCAGIADGPNPANEAKTTMWRRVS